MNNLKAKQQTPANDFSLRVRQLRRQKNLSQEELGKLVGVHYTHIGRYERGTSRPSADTLKRLADVLGVSGDYLLGNSTVETARTEFEDRELLRMFQEIEKSPEEDKAVVKKLLEAFLLKRQILTMATR